MNALLDAYVCHCENPHPRLEHGQDSGLCQTCGMVYDERLYEARLRQFTPNYTFENLHDYLLTADPKYAALAGSQTP
jgi:rubredoxin